MKHQTKENIIQWVKCLLNYKETIPFIVKHREVQIQELQWIGCMEEYDHDHHMKEVAAREITKKLLEKDLIKINSSYIGTHGMWTSKHYQVSAKLSVVLIDGGEDWEYGPDYDPQCVV